jgi:hypothetical protein
MSRATPQLRMFARRLILHERKGSKHPPGFLVCQRLRPQLVTLMGAAGFCALLSRALALAGADHAWLRALQVEKDGTLALTPEVSAQVARKDLSEGQISLITEVLSLLVAFIGEKLTLQLVCESWPQLSLNDRSFGQGSDK